jgi:RNA polymerase sigma-70 factor (ECF subfamily)
MPTRWDWDQARELCYREARRVTRDRALAEDATQDALLRAWRAQASCRSPDAPGPWLAAIARNVAISTVSRERRHERATVAGDSAARDDDARAQDALTQALHRVTFAGVLAALTAADRSLLRLRYEDDLTHSEIARRVGLPEGTVKVRLHRLRARLRQELTR